MKRALAYILATAMLFASLAACSRNAATTIRLMKIEGTVSVADGDGRDIQPQEGLMIYSGYGMDTAPVSYAWMNLDDVKLAKMDEESAIQIKKSGKELEIAVDRGGLFFNVTEPLAEDETMNIRTSTMVVGIRGTCGWVRVDGNEMAVYIIEGTVACSVSDLASGEEKTDTVSGGEMARLILTPGAQAGKRCQIIKGEFTLEDVPAFVRDELDEALTVELRPEDALTTLPAPAPGPSDEPPESSTDELSEEPTEEPSEELTDEPADEPTAEPGVEPSNEPSGEPTGEPTSAPSAAPTAEPTATPTTAPTAAPTTVPTTAPTAEPTPDPTPEPTQTTGIVGSGEYGDNVTWSLSSDGVLTIGGTGRMDGSSNNIRPWNPTSSNGFPEIQTVIIENGVTNIGESTFFTRGTIRNVTIPNSVTVIGSSAFRECTSLTTVTIPNSVTEIGDNAFNGCTSLTSITLPSNLDRIQVGAFNNCTSLTSITIPSTVTKIDRQAFDNCTNLNYVYFQGTQDQFESIDIGFFNDALLNATIRYNS